MASEEPEKGDQVSWQWSGGRPSGEVVEKKTEGELSIQSKKGNTIKKNASADNPALHIARPGNDVVKRQSEVEVDEKAAAADAADEEEKKEENGTTTEAQPGTKHPRDDGNEDTAPEGSTDAKKAKTATTTTTTTTTTPAKARGRPKKAAEEKPKATPAKKPTAAEKKSAAAEKKEAAAAEKKEAATAAAAEKKDEATAAAATATATATATTAEPKKARGRPKKAEGEKKVVPGGAGAAKKEKKVRTPATTDGVGSRTRSKKT